MSNLDKLISLGAYSCGGDLILGRKIVGHLRNGDLHLTDDGKQVIEQDVEDAVEVVRPKRKAKAEAKADPLVDDSGLGDLLN